jgi:hypothetical protein
MIYLIWKKELKNIAHNTADKIKISLIALSIIFSCGICGYMLSSQVLSLYLDSDSKALYMLLMSELVTISIITIMFFIITKALTPEQNVITKILICFPLKRIERKLGYVLPQIINIVICSFMFIFILYIPAMFVNKISLSIIIGFVICLILQSFIITLLIFSIFEILMFIASQINIPYYKNITTVVTILLVVMYCVNYMKKFSSLLKGYIDFKYNLANLMSPIIKFFNADLQIINVNYFIIVAITIFIIVMFILSISVCDSINETKPLKIFKFINFSKKLVLNLSIKELKILMRNETVILFDMLIYILAIVCRVKFNFTISYKEVSIIIAVLSSFASVNSFGIEEKNIPLYKCMGITFKQFANSKILGNIESSLIKYLLLLIIFFDTKVDIVGVCIGFFAMIFSILTLYLIGTIAPINEDKPFTQGLVSMTIIICMIPVPYIMNKLLLLNESIVILISACTTILLYLGIITQSKIKWNREL